MASDEEHSKDPRLPFHNGSEQKIAHKKASLSIVSLVYSLIGRLSPLAKTTAESCEDRNIPNLAEGITINEKLYDFARGLHPEAWYMFKRFETLSLFNIYHYQHELVRLNQKIDSYKESWTGLNGTQIDSTKEIREEDIMNVRKLLREYHEAIRNIKEISQMKRPEMSRRTTVVDVLSKKLDCKFYTTAGDALSMLDLTPEALNTSPDKIRVAIQHYALSPEVSLLADYQEERMPPSQRPSHMFIHPTTDIVARLIISILGGVFLMLPMISLAYTESLLVRQLFVVMFVFLFAVCVALGSNSSNQEFLMASAAYSAVLVVFVGRV